MPIEKHDALIIFGLIIMIMGFLDYIWLGVIKHQFFLDIGKAINCSCPNKTNMASIVGAYLVMAFSIYYFIFYLPEKKLEIKDLIIRTSILSFCIYAVFDITLANLSNVWTWQIALEDIIWGNILFIITAVFTHYILKLFNKF